MAEPENYWRPWAIAVLSGLALAMAAPVALAALSPFLAYRTAVHIVAGFAGILCLALFLIQPLLAAGYLSGLPLAEARKWHRRLGTAIVVLVGLHVGGLFLVSPVDALDALLLVAPTPFSVYGVVAMWGVVATAIIVALRRRLGVTYATWRGIHNALALLVVISTVIHALQIEGAMEFFSKWALCIAVVPVAALTVLDQRIVRPLLRRRRADAAPPQPDIK